MGEHVGKNATTRFPSHFKRDDCEPSPTYNVEFVILDFNSFLFSFSKSENMHNVGVFYFKFVEWEEKIARMSENERGNKILQICIRIGICGRVKENNSYRNLIFHDWSNHEDDLIFTYIEGVNREGRATERKEEEGIMRKRKNRHFFELTNWSNKISYDILVFSSQQHNKCFTVKKSNNIM